MRRIILMALVLVASASLNSVAAKDRKKDKKTVVAEPVHQTDSVSYAMGLGMGRQLIQMGAAGINIDDFAKAMKDVVAGDSVMFTDREAQTIVQAFLQEQERKMMAANKEQGERFLAENKAKEGVVTLPSGLQYKVIKQGDGAVPKATDEVEVVYEGKTLDGNVFDSTAKHGTKSDTFNAGRLIKGWTEALTMMPVGSKWELYIPQELAYGERGAGRNIKPYSTLIFTLELLGIK